MTRSQKQMLTAVLQSLALDALAQIITHYAWSNTKTKINDYEFFAGPDFFEPIPDVNFTALREAAAAAESQNPTNLTALNGTKVILHNATFTVNESLHTFGNMWSDAVGNESFWLKSLPKEMLMVLVLTVLNYLWMLWLERILPGRKRGDTTDSSSSVSSSAVMAEKMGMEDDAAEEEIIKRWIARGKVQRSSLSWWNTFLKFAMDQSFGNAWRSLIIFVIGNVVIARESLKSMRQTFWIEFIGFFLSQAFSVDSLGTFVSFILVPAYKRVVFISLSSLAWTIFFQAGLNVILPWLLSQKWMQEIIRNANEANRNATIAEAAKNKTLEVSWDRPEL